jgi:hypothetical protein
MSSIKQEDQISVLVAFDAMRQFIDDYWKRGGSGSDDIAVLLGSLNRDEIENSLPLDAALWHDWLKAVSKKI